MNHDHRCWCGTEEKTPHEIGDGTCCRFMVEPPTFDNGETLFTWTQQRGYYQHPCGCWSTRPGGSENSLDA